MLKRNKVPGHIVSAQFEAELKFRVVEVDPVSGDIEGEEDGFPEEYPLEDVELSTADFMRKVSSTCACGVGMGIWHGHFGIII